MVREKKRKLIISRKPGALRKEERAAESNRRQNPMKVKVRRVFFFFQFEVHWVPYDFQENGFTRKISNKLLCKALDGSKKFP